MSFAINPQASKAVLLGSGQFPKDNTLRPIASVNALVNRMATLLADGQTLGIQKSDIFLLHTTSNNTVIKEQIALAADQASSALIVYYCGHLVVRKGKVYLATQDSSRAQIHVNGIALADLMNLLRESEAQFKLVLFDADYCSEHGDMPEADVKAVEAELARYEEDLRNTFVLAAAHHKAVPNEDQPVLTSAFLDILQQGVQIEDAGLRLQDIYQAIGEKFKVVGDLPKPVRGTASAASAVKLFPNRRYVEFLALSQEAATHFEQQQFAAALPLYQKAQALFPANTGVSTKAQFIHLLFEGDAAAKAGEWDKALARYEAANSLYAPASIQQKIRESLEKIADNHFGQSRYEQAKDNYDRLAKAFPDVALYHERLEKCQNEILFAELVDEGDRFYFVDNFAGALECYDRALTINHDHQTKRRRDECARFIEKEQAIKAKLEVGLKEEVKEELRYRYEKQLREELEYEYKVKQFRIEEELRERLRREIAHEQREELEKSFWTGISLWNNSEAYQFYIDFFPEGRHLSKARQRIEELALRAAEEAAIAATVAQAAAQPVSSNGHHELAVAQPQEAQAEVAPSAIAEPVEVVADLAATLPVAETPAEIVESPAAQTEVAQTAVAQTAVAQTEEAAPAAQEASADVEENGEGSRPRIIKWEEIELPKAFRYQLEEAEENAGDLTSFIHKLKPQDQSDEAPKKLTEEELWAKAAGQHSIEGYMHYLDNTEESKYVVEAYHRINQLNHAIDSAEEQAAIAEAKPVVQEVATPVVTAPPPSAEVIEDREEEQLWQSAVQTNTISGFYNYINNTSRKKYWEQAKGRINQLKEEARQSEESDWRSARQEDTVEGYKSYIRRYPLGSYYAEAMFQINRLETSKINS